jgi:hypothetical protein
MPGNVKIDLSQLADFNLMNPREEFQMTRILEN